MTEKRFYVAESNLIDGYCVFDREKKYAFTPRPRKADCLNDTHTLNELNNEVKSQSLVIKEYQERTEKLFNENEQLKQQLRLVKE